MKGSYYNEIDPFAAEWLRQLIARGLIAPGEVDERDICAVQPDDVRAFAQCHFFAGIGAWSHALRLAGWADDAPVWTGSCPCQPFSIAGRRGGTNDERHLWPEWFRLIRECRPFVCFGEQVASADGLYWFDLVSADLEGEAYAVAAADLCAAGIGAPHKRQRLFFVAHADGGVGRQGGAGLGGRDPGGAEGTRAGSGGGRRAVGVALGDADSTGPEGRRRGERADQRPPGPSGLAGFWRDAGWLPCRDGKVRSVEPGSFPLAHGAAARVGRLRAYGNALVAPLAAEFIAAYLEARGDL